jgi:hypothetical protein
MEWKQFWKVIEDAYRPDGPDHYEALISKIAELPWPEIVGFQVRFDEALAAANTLNIEGAAYLINGGEHGEGFHDFRCWLVGRGRHAYEAALKHPDSLADILDGDPVDGFGLESAALRAYEQRTGASDFYEVLDAAEKNMPPAPPEGDDWDFEDETEMQKRFPRLCHLYLVPQEDVE